MANVTIQGDGEFHVLRAAFAMLDIPYNLSTLDDHTFIEFEASELEQAAYELFVSRGCPLDDEEEVDK
jgi:hypothetical protein